MLFKKNKMYNRLKDLYDKVFKVVPYSDRLKKANGPCMVSFKSNLGERLIHIDYSLGRGFDFEYSIYYMEKVNNTETKSIFMVRAECCNTTIIQPEYKIGEKQITPEEINLAILELEEHINPLYELYLKDLKYHKEQEKKLESL